MTAKAPTFNINKSYSIGKYIDVNNPKILTDCYATPHQRGGLMYSIGHKQSKAGYTEGGPFWLEKDEVICTPSGGFNAYWGSIPMYRGTALAAIPIGMAIVDIKTFGNNLMLRSSEAWNRLKPDKPDFTLASSIFELRELPKMFKDATSDIIRLMVEKYSGRPNPKRRDRRKLPAKVGEWHLALQFGWLPLLSDIRNFVKAQKESQQRLTQLIRDEGRPIRRSTTLKEADYSGYEYTGDERYTYPGSPWLYPSLVTQCYFGGVTHREQRRVTARTWAEAKWRYLLPPGPRDVSWNRKMMRRIMGGMITPTALYEIMPWSWLIDYFVDLGQFMKAISPGVSNSLVADYAFLMRSLESTTTLTSTEFVHTGKGGKQLVSATTDRLNTRRFRSPASPFGFGVKQGNLSLQQIGILGALGYSRLPNGV